MCVMVVVVVVSSRFYVCDGGGGGGGGVCVCVYVCVCVCVCAYMEWVVFMAIAWCETSLLQFISNIYQLCDWGRAVMWSNVGVRPPLRNI